MLGQRNLERLFIEIRHLRPDTRMIQTEIQGLQTEIRLIFDLLRHRDDYQQKDGDRDSDRRFSQCIYKDRT